MAIRVLIVDDEERQRSGLRRHVRWEDYRMRVTAEAESAEQALELVQTAPPDLVITDIRMLGADGLSLCGALRRINPAVRVIVVTGYEQFEYAKTAVELGVDAFLVKPIDFTELGRVLEEVSRAHFSRLRKGEEEAGLREQLRALLPFARDAFVRDLLNGAAGDDDAIHARARHIGLFTAGTRWRVAVAVAEAMEGQPPHDEEAKDLIRLRLCRIAEGVLGGSVECMTTTGTGDSVVILGGSGASREGNGGDGTALLERFQDSAQEECACRLSIGVGCPVDSPRMIADSYRQGLVAVNQRLIEGSGQIIHWTDVTGGSPIAGVTLDSLVSDAFSLLRQGDAEAMRGKLDAIISLLIAAGPGHESEARGICLQLMSGACRCTAELGASAASPLPSEQDLWRRVLDCGPTVDMMRTVRDAFLELCGVFGERRAHRHRQIVQAAISCMRERHGEELTLHDVAATVFLSPSYLGAILRAETGQSFTDILTGIRMKRARELLADPRLKLYEVSESVGYRNPAYFSSLFKRHAGLTPREFRDLQENDAPEGPEDNTGDRKK